MPLTIQLNTMQSDAVAAQDTAISQVQESAILGTTPLVRVVFEDRHSVMKFFDHRSIWQNEIRALTRLSNCQQAPRLHKHGQCLPGFSLPTVFDSCFPYQFWLCRDWIDKGDARRLPIINPVGFAYELDRFVSACNAQKLSMGDPKRTNFTWDGVMLSWLDYGWFTVESSAVVKQRNEEFRTKLLRKLGW